MAAYVSGSGVEFSIASTGGTWSWSVRANNIQGAGQFYEFLDIHTPYGPLVQTHMPLPGDVVEAMAQSLSDLRQQFAPLMSLLDPTITTFNVVVVEGDASETAASVVIYNSGAFGSFLTATATPSVSWLTAEPSAVAGLGKNDQGTFDVVLNPAALLESASPYSGIVRLQDNRVPATVVNLAFTVSVLPKPAIAVSPLVVNFSYMLSTLSGTGPFDVTVQNAGPPNSLLDWEAAKLHNTSAWLEFTPSSGGPLASGAEEDIALSLVAGSIPQVPGVYTDTIRITSPTASNGFVDAEVFLTVTP